MAILLNGGKRGMSNSYTPVESEGASRIIEEAMKDDGRPLYIAFLGPLTDMASALIIEPRIADRNIKVIWIGGRDWPTGGWEYNLSNDIHELMWFSNQLWKYGRSQGMSTV